MKRHIRLLIALLVGLSLLAAACGDDDDTSSGDTSSTAGTDDTGGAPEGPAIKIGAQDFGESKILSEIYKQAFEASGYEASVSELGGYRDLLFGAFESGDVNFAPDYAASALEFLNSKKGEATEDAAETVALLQGYLDAKGIVALDPAPGVNTNAFVMTKAKATELGVTTLSDLAGKEDGLKLGAPQDCETNPNCIPGLKETYGVDLSSGFVGLETGAAIAAALEAGEVDIAVMFTTDGVIAAKDFQVLEDDKHLFKADNVTPIASQAVVDAYGDDFEALVSSISEKLTTEELVGLNKRFDIDKEDADAIAASWLEDNGLI
jgi:osmoprotectant transport system substrate-binding protein